MRHSHYSKSAIFLFLLYGVTGFAQTTLTPSTLSFGNQVVSQASTAKTATLKNTQSVALTINTIAIGGANAGDFVSGGTCPISPSTLAAGKSCSITVTFTPSILGSETASLTVTHNATTSPQTVALTGTGVVPVNLSSAKLPFLNQAEGTSSAPKTETLTNVQAAALTITSISITGSFNQTGGTCPTAPATLAGGASCTILVAFSPATLGALTGTLTVTDSASNSPQTASLTGTGVAPVTVSPATLSFGNLAQGNTSGSKNLTVTNVQPIPLTISDIAISGPFTHVGGTCQVSPATVAPGTNCTVIVAFAPTAVAPATGTLTILDDAGNSPRTVSLTGTGITPATVAPATLNFGTLAVGSSSAAKTVILTNKQNTFLNFSSVAVSGDFSVSSNTCGSSIGAGGTCTVGVTFSPSMANPRSGELIFTDSAANSPQVIELTGTGATPVTLSVPSLNLGTVAVGNTSTAKTVTLTNHGNQSLGFGSILASGGFAVASNTCGTSVAAGANCIVGVTFSPTALGAANGSLTFSDNATNSPQFVALTGIGSASATVSTTSLSFGSVAIGKTSAAKNVTLTNQLNTAIPISSVAATGDFQVASNTCTPSVGPGLNCKLGITFTPTVAGPRSGSLTIGYGAFGSPIVVSLSGGVASITISPATPSVPLGNTQQFTATANISGGTQDVTQAVVWSSSATTVATISAAGLATTAAQGSTTITATLDSVQATSALTVTAPALVSIGVTPANPSIPILGTQQFTATGTYTNGSTQNITSSASFSSSSTSIATVNGAGLATAGSTPGTTTVQATLGAVNGSTSLTVTAGFLSTGGLTTSRFSHTATILSNGLVLIAGGVGSTGNSLASAELYNPATGTSTPTGSLTAPRAWHTSTLLNNGMVLITGGCSGCPAGSSGSSLASTEIYNPATGTFTSAGFMTTAREFHTATLLGNGQVLIAGGLASGSSLNSAELYDPIAGTFSLTGSMTYPRYFQTATLLNDGTALIAGGENTGSSPSFTTAEIYNSSSGVFTPASSNMVQGRFGHTATLLNSGQVLLAGGTNAAGAELYDPVAGTFTATANLNNARSFQNATLLNNGTVLIAGGYDPNVTTLSSAEIFDPVAGTFTLAESLSASRYGASATLLGNGNVFSAGGAAVASGAFNTVSYLASAQLFQPASFTPAGLVSISIRPRNLSLPLGTAQHFIGVGAFSDGSSQTLQSLNWSTSNPALFTVGNDATNSGTAYAVAAGAGTITACAGSVCGPTSLTVTAPSLLSITVTPSSASISAGGTQQFAATGTYTDGSTQNLTNSVAWSASPTGVASITSSGLASPVGDGITTISAAIGAVQGTAVLHVSVPVLTSIFVTPSNSTLVVGRTQQFTATGTYSDSTTQDLTASVIWSSFAGAVASMNSSGLVTGVSPGSTTIQASLGSLSGSTMLNVNAAGPTLLSITVLPSSSTVPIGGSLQLQAIGNYSDNSSLPLTTGLTWSSSASSVVSISTNGFATALAAGSASITATQASVSGSAALQTASGFVYAANSSGYAATSNISGYLENSTSGALTAVSGSPVSDGSVPDWIAADASGRFLYTADLLPSVVSGYSIDANTGNLTPVPGSPFAAGPATRAIALSPAGNFVYAASQTGNVYGYSMNGSGTLTPISGSPFASDGGANAVSIDPTGTFLYLANADSTTVSAFTINATTGALTVVPGSPYAARRGAWQVAIHPSGKFAYVPNSGDDTISAFSINQTTGALTPVSGSPFTADSAPGGAAIDHTGSFLYVANIGSDSVSAYSINSTSGALTQVPGSPFNTASGSTPISVSIDASNQELYVAAQGSGQVFAFAMNATTGALTAVSGSPFAAGPTTRSVTTVPTSIPPAVTLTSLQVVPTNPTIVENTVGATKQFTAVGTYGDGKTRFLTGSATWTSSTPSVATISNTSGSIGLATTIGYGTATITASYGGQSATTNLTVQAPALISIVITPANATIPSGTALQFSAKGTYSDNSTKDLTSSVTWTSSAPQSANIVGGGLATSFGLGVVTITATNGSVSQSTTLMVAPAVTFTPGTSKFVYAANSSGYAATSSISGYLENAGTGTLTPVSGSPFADGSVPDWIAADAGGRFLYTADLLPNVVSGYSIEPNSGSLTPIPGSPFTTGPATRAVTLSPAGNFLYAASQTGSVYGFSLGSNGALTPISGSPFASASGANSISIDSSGKFLYLANADATIVSAFTINPSTGILTPVPGSPFAAGRNPWQVAIVPSGNFAYVTNSGDDTISAYSINHTTGALTPISGSPFAAASAPGGAAIDQTGTFLYTANIGSDSVSGYLIDLMSGVLTPVPGSPFATASGSTPISVSIDASNQHLYVAAQGSSQVFAFGINPSTGALTPVSGSPIAAGPTTRSVTAVPAAAIQGPTLLSISVTPTNPMIASGHTQQFTATGTYSDSSTQDLTSSAIWTSSFTPTATITASGLATGQQTGTTTITATSGTISGSTILVVQTPMLVSISVTPNSPVIGVGKTVQFTATGTYNDSSTQDLTGLVIWNSQVNTTASIVNGGLATGLSAGITLITATVGNVTGSAQMTVMASAGTFTSTTSMGQGRAFQTATVLNSGSVLVAGGTDGNLFFNSSERYDPVSATWASAGTMTNARDLHTATVLPNGKILVVGGFNGSAISGAELYDPTTGIWTVTQSLATARYEHRATLLPIGKVLVTGGHNESGSISSAELYDPLSGTWTSAGVMNSPRYGHAAVLLSNGKVLVAGGRSPNSPDSSAEVYDPTTGSWSTTGRMTAARYGHTATLLNNGRVVVAGGYNLSGYPTSTELYDPTSGVWTAVGNNANGRAFHTATLLTNGQVVIAGGAVQLTSLSSAELFDPSGSVWTSAGSMAFTREGLAAVLLTNGNVLVAGGTSQTGPSLNSAEVYQPASTTPPNLTSITVSPTSATAALGGVQQFVATGTFSDSSTQTLASVIWSSGSPGVATISNDSSNQGEAIAFSLGTTTITATAGAVSGSATLTVSGSTPTLTSIRVTPLNPSILSGSTLQFVATGTYSDASTQDVSTSVTWSSLTTSVATISTAGLATAVASGTSAIQAILGSVTGGTTLTVAAPSLLSINVTPSNPSIAAGGSQQFTAIGTYADSSTQNLSSSVVWTSSAPTVAGINTSGLASNTLPGTTTITATLGSVSGSTSLTVVTAVSFTYTGAMTFGRFAHQATTLANGLVLITGGTGQNGSLNSAELYNPSTGLFAPTGSLNAARANHTATLLGSGLVLITGGRDDTGNILASAELYDPSSGTFSVTNNMQSAREFHTATLLADGATVLIAGGDQGFQQLASAETYNSGLFGPMPSSLSATRSGHTATLLNNGQVLIAGGSGFSQSADLWDPFSAMFTPVPMNASRTGHTATLLNGGKVLIVGGSFQTNAAEVYDPVAGLFSLTGSPSVNRQNQSAVLLSNGQVLVAGGNGPIASAELYDPASGTFSDAGNMTEGRSMQTATWLSNGTALIAGGQGASGALATVELYHPLTLTPAGLSLITVSPVNQLTFPGGSLNYTATGLFTDASTQVLANVLWSSSNPLVASVENGHVTAISPGGTLISASAGSVSGSTSLTVAPPVLQSINLVYNYPAVPLGQTQQYTAYGLYSDGTSPEITNSVIWNSSVTTVATISQSGLAASVGLGTTNITATLGSVTGQPASLQVVPAATTLTGSMAQPRSTHTATVLGNGQVLIAGGTGSGLVTRAELYDPVAGAFTQTGNLVVPRSGHAAALLGTGKVLLVGGTVLTGNSSSAELYDPGNGTFSASVVHMTIPRAAPVATSLANGKVLVTSGGTAELYDPAGPTFTATGNMMAVRSNYTATLLSNGKVLVVGGTGLSSAELYDPVAGTFSFTGSMSTSRANHKATLLVNGTVLITGGQGPLGDLSTAEIYNPATGQFTLASGSLTYSRERHAAILLPNGLVVVTGGIDFQRTSNAYVAEVEVFNPATGTFSYAGNLAAGRTLDSVTLLNTGRVLIVGGANGTGPLSSAELY